MAVSPRRDEEIRSDVLAELAADPAVSEPLRIGVAVHNGVVTLSGLATSLAQKREAESAARRIDGVRALVDDIDVQLLPEYIHSDNEIAAAAANALKWDVEAPGERIHVSVRDGWVTLEGNVDYWHQMQAAGRDVFSLQGVKGVINQLELTPSRVSAADAKANIERALRRNADLDAEHIDVRVSDGHIVLTGDVRSLAQREEAEAVARSTLGVYEVENKITVTPMELGVPIR